MLVTKFQNVTDDYEVFEQPKTPRFIYVGRFVTFSVTDFIMNGQFWRETDMLQTI
jgi:hypothetical protein